MGHFLKIGIVSPLFLIGACVPHTPYVSSLEDRVPYHEDGGDRAVMIYTNPDLKITSYSNFLIEQVKISSNDSLSLPKKEEEFLAEAFRKELIDVLESGYGIVNEPGPGVLRVRVIIQDIQPAKVDFVEEGAVVLRLDTLLARVAMEIDCLDSVSGERVAALIHTLHDRRYFDREKKKRLLNIREAFGVWARSLRQRFDAAKARASGSFEGRDPAENRKIRFEEGN